MLELESAVAQVLRSRGQAALELALFGTAEPRAIAALIERFCREQLGAGARHCLFYRASTGCVLGIALEDGRRCVVKVHAPSLAAARLAACRRVQADLHARGFPCPEPLLGPQPLGRGLATVESYLAAGERGDAHAAAIRGELAARLCELTHGLDPERLGAGLGASWFGGLPAAQLWPRPHAPGLDFAASAGGAEWIDELARRARGVALAGARVIAHFDWRAEHFRFDAGRICAAYDWDSLHCEREPIAVGAAAHAFTAQDDREDIDPAPSLAEIRAFIAGYESARGRAFAPDELRCAAAACVYSLAYSARCEHARGADRADPRGGAFRRLLHTVGPALLDERA